MADLFHLRPLRYLLLTALLATGGCNRDDSTYDASGEAVSGTSAIADSLAEMIRRSKLQHGSVDGIVEQLAAADVTAILRQSNLRSLHYTEAEYAELSSEERDHVSEELDDLNLFFKAVGRRGAELAAEARRKGNANLATRYVRMLERSSLVLKDRKRMAFVRDIGTALSRRADEASR